MKTLITLAAILTISLSGNAQKLKEYKAINEITYKVGDTVKLGRGSAPNGSFLYLQIGGWSGIMGYDANKGPDQNNVGRKYANTAVIVKKIRRDKIKGIYKVLFTVGGGNITNYWLYIDDAIQTCEVTPCTDNNATSAPVADNLDKIKKLKSLLDSGAITQTEYDEQKKKLLSE